MFTKNELPEGWQHLSAEEARAIEAELEREVGKEHVLYQAKVKAIARRVDQDDFLFLAESSEYRLYVVHLTWCQETNPALPHTTHYADKFDFIFNGS